MPFTDSYPRAYSCLCLKALSFGRLDLSKSASVAVLTRFCLPAFQHPSLSLFGVTAEEDDVDGFKDNATSRRYQNQSINIFKMTIFGEKGKPML